MNSFKKILISIIILSGLLLAQNGFADFVGSVHDFTGEPWHMPTGPCVSCHTPHFSTTEGPLWNHMTTTQTFTLYNSNSLDTALTQPDGPSKLCLSCHDGITAVTASGGNDGENPYYVLNPLGIDLSDDHPVSFVYDTALSIQDGELHDPSSRLSGLGSTIQDDLLTEDKLECSTCHDVHNTLSVGNDFLLKISASDLCLTCHDK